MSIVIIIGPPRSGTTWLARELARSPNAFPMLPECSTLTAQIRLFHETRYLDKHRFNAFYNTQQECREHFRKIVLSAADLAKRINPKTGAERLILKDPVLSLYVSETKDLLPESEVIACFRDPRDVIASMKKVSEKKRGEKWSFDHVIVEIFNYYHIIMLSRDTDTAITFAKYEDLVTLGIDSVRVAAGLTKPDPVDGDKIYEQLKFDQQDPFFSQLYLEKTTQSKIGSFREILTADEIAKVESVFSGVMLNLGYS